MGKCQKPNTLPVIEENYFLALRTFLLDVLNYQASKVQ